MKYIRKCVTGSNIHIEVNELKFSFTHFGSSLEMNHDVSASQLEVLVT